ncbi:helix-turn-helix transcriptional regulator [Candidatus Venteria ishoeyi]|uniref:helix-turn-helix domain-containing protein n=1 Tax=Candidatus Venteria ishoeyi TaxID=1899563 RepID=UPI0025A5BFF2|nr:helix-turn-helix transcriptional regulator [Candidatus Venteria ishoeyi]MDM8546295.1 helix-turn-helix transcriptional regulator [Candidatus Venteria ishoeyi]
MDTDTDTWHITPTGGNVFADLGFEPVEAQKLKIKSELMIELSRWIKENELKQEEAAKVLKVSRPRVSDVMRGKVAKFTIDALVDMVELTGHHVNMSVS